MTKENSNKYNFLTFLFFDEFSGGEFEKGKRDPNEPKAIFLLIKTYFSEYLRPEWSPAARRCACCIIGCFVRSALVENV